MALPGIRDLADRLADAFEAKGVRVRDNLNPGLDRRSILQTVAPLGFALPEEVVQLYEWRNGSTNEDSGGPAIIFRDNRFISLERAVEEREEFLKYYGVDSTLELDRVDLRACFPIGTLDGAWTTVACGRHLHPGGHPNPVINVFQGVDMHYHSVRTMLMTCMAWVVHPQWRYLYGLGPEAEMEIWQEHNPGIFALPPN
jgi:hypothetical protein